MAFTLPDLPYAKTAFGDTISEDTFDYHHGKHHKAYVDKTNAAIEKTGLSSPKLSEVILHAKSQGDNQKQVGHQRSHENDIGARASPGCTRT